jgi:hypothetical protein
MLMMAAHRHMDSNVQIGDRWPGTSPHDAQYPETPEIQRPSV